MEAPLRRASKKKGHAWTLVDKNSSIEFTHTPPFLDFTNAMGTVSYCVRDVEYPGNTMEWFRDRLDPFSRVWSTSFPITGDGVVGCFEDVTPPGTQMLQGGTEAKLRISAVDAIFVKDIFFRFAYEVCRGCSGLTSEEVEELREKGVIE